MNQREAVLKYLKTHSKGLTAGMAYEFLGVMCLHKRIAELEAQGYKIGRITKEFTNRYGNKSTVMWYRLNQSN